MQEPERHAQNDQSLKWVSRRYAAVVCTKLVGIVKKSLALQSTEEPAKESTALGILASWGWIVQRKCVEKSVLQAHLSGVAGEVPSALLGLEVRSLRGKLYWFNAFAHLGHEAWLLAQGHLFWLLRDNDWVAQATLHAHRCLWKLAIEWTGSLLRLPLSQNALLFLLDTQLCLHVVDFICHVATEAQGWCVGVVHLSVSGLQSWT